MKSPGWSRKRGRAFQRGWHRPNEPKVKIERMKMNDQFVGLARRIARSASAWSVATILIAALCQTAHAAKGDKLVGASTAGIDAQPGSPELPLVYDGPRLADKTAPDGGMPLCPGVQNIQISRANRKPSPFFGDTPGYTYQHHQDLAVWKGRLYAVWDMTVKDEDTPPCRLAYATSTDGFNWTGPKNLFPPNEGWNLRFYFYRASNDRMLVFAAAPYKTKRMAEKNKICILVREITADHQLGKIYTLIQPGPNHPPSFEQSEDSGFVAACREACNNKPLLEQQDYGILLGDRRMKWHDAANWPGGKMGGLGHFWTFGKALCFFHRQDGTLVSLCKLGFVSLSKDEGETWSLPVVPASLIAGTGKVWAQKTPDGRYAMIYPPKRPGPRFPMVITTSDDGITFRNMRVVHGEVPPVRYVGASKDIGPQYLRGVAEWAGDAFAFDKTAIWVVYSMNKEDIWVSRIPVPVQADARNPVHDSFEDMPVGPRIPGWNIYSPLWAPVRIAKETGASNQYLELDDHDPIDYARAARTFPRSNAGDISFRLAAAQADRGRLEIDLLGDKGARPVQLWLDDHGRLQARDGERSVDLGKYKPDQWKDFIIRVKAGHYTLLCDGKAVLKDAAFAEPSRMVYALSFRTGEYRATAPEKTTLDLPGTEEPAPKSVYRVDDVSTSNLERLP
jgi:Sialidase-like, CBM domain